MTTTKPKTLQELREEQKLSIYDVCRRAGVGERELRQWEAGQGEIPAAYLPKLANAFGMPLNQIELEPHRRHYANRGHDLVLRTSGHPRSGYTAHVDVIVRGDKASDHTTDQYAFLSVTAPTKEASLDALTTKLDEAFAQQTGSQSSGESSPEKEMG